MVLRINHNIAVMTAHRHVRENSDELIRSLEKLSSGMKINRAADGASGLIISEQMRAQVSGIKQAIDNSEVATGMVQTTEAALNEVNKLLVKIRQLATHAANDGANDSVMLKADQFEIRNALDTIDRITFSTQFGNKRLLDGSQGANGLTNGEGLEFMKASHKTKPSPATGYDVHVTALPSRAYVMGETPLDQEAINAGETLTIAEGGRTVSFTARRNESVSQAVGRLKNEIETIGLDLDLEADEEGYLRLTHKNFGSDHTFMVASSTPGILSAEAGVMEKANRGQDIRGTIDGYAAHGKGRELTGGEGAPVEDITVRYTGNVTSAEGDTDPGSAVGRVSIYQNSLTFQVGGNVGQQVKVSLNSTNTRTLGRGVKNASGFKSLRDISVDTPDKAADVMRVVEKAINDVTTNRAELGAFQKNTLESNLTQLKIAEENLTSAESVIRDADMAQAMADYTRNSILMQSSSAMMAQANQISRTVLSLLD
ncbi:MAG: flagellin [Deltaproteobacteria bacterium]|nr:flagellin [Deltaproteobacteria bacterium]